MSEKEPIRLAIRGAGGLLGHRLISAILRTQKDMSIDAVIIGQCEESFRRLESACRIPQSNFRVFLDAKHKEVRALMNAWKSKWELEPLDQSFGALNKTNAIVDCSIIKGRDSLCDFYESYSSSKPIVHQSGRYPNYIAVGPPFEPSYRDGDFNYRQGDCLVSGIAPVLFPFRDDIEGLSLRGHVQRQKPLHGPTIQEKMIDIIIDPELEKQVEHNISLLLTNIESDAVDVSITQSPAHIYYLFELTMRMKESKSVDEVLSKLRSQPRVAVAPPEIPLSTGDLQQHLQEPYQENGIPLQPIIVFSCRDAVVTKGKTVKLHAAIYSRAITKLPNIDTVRGLVRNQAMIIAMKTTDTNYGFQEIP